MKCLGGFLTARLGRLLLAAVLILAWTARLQAALGLVPGAVLEAEAERIAVMAAVKDSVVAIFSPTGDGGGSGVVISPDGFALTNYHVVKPCGDAMKCGLPDGKLYDAVIVGVDPAGDMALIKLFGRDDFPVAEMGDSDRVRLGDECFAMGSPFVLATDFQPTVTWGIVSGTHRYQYPAGTLLEYTDCIQTDASINPGNSGGPLFDAQGRLIGINGRASFDKRGRVNVGAAYAISINQIKNFLGHLHSGRIVDHATLGATVAADREGNVMVNDVLDTSDAYRRGLRYNAVLLSFGGRTITTPNQFKNALGIYPKGWRVPVSFRQGGTRNDVLVRLRGLHGEEELIRNVAASEPPVPAIPQEPDAENQEPEPDGQAPLPGRPPQRVRQRPEPMPEIAKQHFESKRGFANYFFNKRRQERILAAWNAQGRWREATSPWTLVGQLGGGGDFALTIDANQCRLELPAATLKWPAPDHFHADLAPPQSGGLFPALLIWRRLAVEGPESLDDVYYLGTAPLSGQSELLDVLVGRFRGVDAWFYFHPSDGTLLAVDLFSDGDDADPCELLFLDYREQDGRRLPTRIEVVHADAPYVSFHIDAWRFEPSDREPITGHGLTPEADSAREQLHGLLEDVPQ